MPKSCLKATFKVDRLAAGRTGASGADSVARTHSWPLSAIALADPPARVAEGHANPRLSKCVGLNVSDSALRRRWLWISGDDFRISTRRILPAGAFANPGAETKSIGGFFGTLAYA